MNNEQQRGGQSSGKNQVPPMTDKKEFKKNTKQKDIEAEDEDMGGSCSSKGGSCGSDASSDDDDVEA